MLEQIAGQLIKRSPTLGVSHNKKIIYTTYPAMWHPDSTPENTTQYIQPIPQSEVFSHFKQRLSEWGYTSVVLKDWILIIDARQEIFLPHVDFGNTINEQLSALFKEVVVLSNSIYSTKNIPFTHYFFPGACVNVGDWYEKTQSLEIDWQNINIDKQFLLLVRRPTQRRIEFVRDVLLALNNEESGFEPPKYEFVRASCGCWDLQDVVIESDKIRPQLVKLNTTNSEQPKKEITVVRQNKHYPDHLLPYIYPLIIDGNPNFDRGLTPTDLRFFTTLVNIVCESLDADTDAINISEKSFKPFAWHQIPIWHSSPGTVNVVREMGFDVFDDIFDHRYDNELVYKNRKNMIINQLIVFKNKFVDIQNANSLRQELYTRFENNNCLLEKIVNKEKEDSPHHNWPNKLFKR